MVVLWRSGLLCTVVCWSLFPSLLFSQLCHTCLTPTPPTGTTPPHPPLLHCHNITHTTLVTQVHTVTADSSPQGPNCYTPPTDTQPTPPNQARWTCTWFIMFIMSHAHNPTPTGPRRPLQRPYTVVRTCVHTLLYVPLLYSVHIHSLLPLPLLLPIHPLHPVTSSHTLHLSRRFVSWPPPRSDSVRSTVHNVRTPCRPLRTQQGGRVRGL